MPAGPQCLPGVTCPLSTTPPVHPTVLTLPSLPESTHSSMRCGEAAQWICQRWGSEGTACWTGPQTWGPVSLIPPPHIWAGPYNEGLAVDVVQVQGQHVVLAAHVHAVVVLVLEQDPVVSGVEQEVEEVGSACGLQLCGWRAGQPLAYLETIQPYPRPRWRGSPPHGHLKRPASPPGNT